MVDNQAVLVICIWYLIRPDRTFGNQRSVAITRCRILRSYPARWQVHVVNDATGEDFVVDSLDERPTYAALDKLLKDTPGSNSSKGWAERLRSELRFNQDSLKNRD